MRSAWLSVFLSHGNQSFCMHEALLRKPGTLKQMLDRVDTEFKGNSDSTIVFHEIDFPARIVVVRRSLKDAENSVLNLTGRLTREGLLKRYEELDKFASSHEHLEVDFNDLSDIETLEEIWSYCLPGLPFDSHRARELSRLNIQKTY